MVNGDRQKQTLNILQQEKRLSITELSQRLNISIATARRDLDALASEGKVQRVHGGALLVEKAPPEPPILLRSMDQLNEKAHIGAKAASMIRAGETIFLGSGTTVLETARRLPHLQNLTIITNSLPVANALATRTDINLVILGGIFRHSECTAYGQFTEQALAELHADKVIFGIRAICSGPGLTNDFIPEVQTDRSILKIGREVIIVADHTKFNVISTATVAPLSWVSKIITDNQTPVEVIEEMTALGIEMIVVDCCTPLPGKPGSEHAPN